jgi:hypothetical protein
LCHGALNWASAGRVCRRAHNDFIPLHQSARRIVLRHRLRAEVAGDDCTRELANEIIRFRRASSTFDRLCRTSHCHEGCCSDRLRPTQHCRPTSLPPQCLQLISRAGQSRPRDVLLTIASSLPLEASGFVPPLHDDTRLISVPISRHSDRIIEIRDTLLGTHFSLA